MGRKESRQIFFFNGTIRKEGERLKKTREATHQKVSKRRWVGPRADAQQDQRE